MFSSYLRYLIPFIYIEKKENYNLDKIIPDTIIQIDPNDMTIDIETGHLILITHLEDLEEE
jgi:hypothetical protein